MGQVTDQLVSGQLRTAPWTDVSPDPPPEFSDCLDEPIQGEHQPNCAECIRVDATIIRSIRKSYFHVFYRRHMPATLAWHRPGIVDACQSGNMAALLSS